MRKKSVYLWSLIAGLVMMTACSDQNDENPANGETAEFKFTVSFEEAVKTKAPGSTATPITSWANVKQLQFMLYDASGEVRYSKIENPAVGNTSFTYPDVPVGTYTLVAIANADGDNANGKISTYIAGAPMTWNAYNVRSKDVNTFTLQHTGCAFPSYADPTEGGTNSNKAFEVPSELFKGSVSNITVASGVTATPPALALKREVSLMRVRLNISDADAGVNNGAGAGGVDWTNNASILIYNLPQDMSVINGVNGASSKANILVGATGTTAFKTTEPTAGYGAGSILGGNFTMWNDIVVFPNNKNTVGSAAQIAQKYTIVVSALGQTGHMLANGTVLTSPQTVYWSGLIDDVFSPNKIREANLTLKSGGTTEIPTEPEEKGGLTINVSAPEDWNSVIEDTTIEM